MELNNLRPAKGSNKSSKRIARGQGSGRGGTSTRGHKGDKARSGFKAKRAHEGGQMPIQMRLPKFGFKNVNRVEYVAINLNTLDALAEIHNVTEIEFLTSKKVIKKSEKFKILGTGDLNKVLTVSAHAASKIAQEKIVGLGGTFTTI
jgi:large subunit ribosomal protein L15